MKLHLLLLFVFCTAAVAREREAFAIWDKTCPPVIGEGTLAYAPLVDGQPDFKRVTVKGLVLPTKCWHYEVRK